MTVDYVVQAVHQGGMRFSGSIGTHAFTMDYPRAPGEAAAGPKPMEMLLASLASCAGGTVAALLQRDGQQVDGLTVTARGRRQSRHPTVFTGIDLEFAFRGNPERSAVERAIALAESQVCPVWAMLKPSTPVRSSFRVTADAPGAALPVPAPPARARARRGLAELMGTAGFFLAIVSIVVGLVQIFRWIGQLFR